MKFHNIIAAGCSFTADGIGGLPPSIDNEGCNSFIDYDDFPAATPYSWASHIARDLAVRSFVNLAGGGHGNIMLANSVTEIINQNEYDLDHTLVIFNLTEPERLDIMCAWDHHERSGMVPWDKNIISHSYIGPLKPTYHNFRKNMGLEQVRMQTARVVDMFFSWLENNKIQFVFTMMNNYIADDQMAKIILPRLDRLVQCENYTNMYEYVCNRNLNREDNLHPDREGHRRIADFVLERISLLS